MKNIIKKISIVLVICSTIISCSLWKANEWNSSKVIIEVYNNKGEPLVKSGITTTANQKSLTDSEGRAVLFYQKSGLHIVTVESMGKMTKQIKIRIPTDVNKVVNVVLIDK